MASRYLSHKCDPFCRPIHDYDEGADPFNMHQLKCAVVPGYSFLCHIPIEERSLKHSYDLIELAISGGRGSYADFSMEINIFFYFDHDKERQHLKSFDAHTFLALYNHSFFVRMHVHNAWLLPHTKIDILLPELFSKLRIMCFYFVELADQGYL